MAILSHHNMSVNGDMVKVKIISTENAENFTRHTVESLEDYENVPAGSIIEGVYSYASASVTKMYGITASLFPSYKATREA